MRTVQQVRRWEAVSQAGVGHKKEWKLFDPRVTYEPKMKFSGMGDQNSENKLHASPFPMRFPARKPENILGKNHQGTGSQFPSGQAIESRGQRILSRGGGKRTRQGDNTTLPGGGLAVIRELLP